MKWIKSPRIQPIAAMCCKSQFEAYNKDIESYKSLGSLKLFLTKQEKNSL